MKILWGRNGLDRKVASLHSQVEGVVGLVKKRQKTINANSNTARTQNVKAVLRGNFVDFVPAKESVNVPAFAFVG